MTTAIFCWPPSLVLVGSSVAGVVSVKAVLRASFGGSEGPCSWSVARLCPCVFLHFRAF